MKLNNMTKWMLVGALLLLPACGKKGGFTTEFADVKVGSEEGSLGGTFPEPETPPPVEEKVDLKGFISGGSNDKKQVLFLDTEKGELLLKLPLGKNISVNLFDMQVSKLPGVRIYTSTDFNTNEKSIVLAIPLRYVLRNVTTIPAGRLPNGDALPDMPGGEMPTLGLTVDESKKVRAHLYVGADAVGLFIESSFNPVIPVGFDIISKTQQKVGIFALVPKKGEHQGGFFLGIRLHQTLARALDQFIR